MQARTTWIALVLLTAATCAFLFVQLNYRSLYGNVIYSIDELYAPTVSAHAWAVFDAETGKVLLSENEDVVLPIASVTKLMTAEVTLLDLPLEETTVVSWRAVASEGRAGKLTAGEELRIHELLFPLLIESSNDAAAAIAEYAGGDAFIRNMNARARDMGMHDTHFADASGLSARNVSTVHDLVTLVRHFTEEHQHVFDITRLEKYIGTNHTWWNANPVFSLPGFLGGKNGYTYEADRTLAAVFTQQLKNGRERPIGIVLLGSDDIAEDTLALRQFVRDHVSNVYIF